MVAGAGEIRVLFSGVDMFMDLKLWRSGEDELKLELRCCSQY